MCKPLKQSTILFVIHLWADQRGIHQCRLKHQGCRPAKHWTVQLGPCLETTKPAPQRNVQGFRTIREHTTHIKVDASAGLSGALHALKGPVHACNEARVQCLLALLHCCHAFACSYTDKKDRLI
jgi:hypothetical protein